MTDMEYILKDRYRTDLDSVIKTKITQFANACKDYAFIGAAHPEDMDAIEKNYFIARHNLERIIMTKLEKAND